MADSLDGKDKTVRRYLADIEQYERLAQPWETRGKKILRLYKDADNQRGQKKRFNVLWSNVETLKPALYARDPQPEAERRYKGADPIGRVASEVIERCLEYTIDCEDLGQAMGQVVSDRLLPGRGTVWVKYVPTIDGEGDDEEVSYEEAKLDYVYWEDFGHNVARTWQEVTCVWRRVYMSRTKLVKRFGEAGQDVPLDYVPKGIKDEALAEGLKKACVYEIWDRETQTVYFLSKQHPTVIEESPYTLKLTGGFPCPRPLYSTLTTDSLIPTPDYALYQTQANEIETLTARIDLLQKALKLAGAYDSSAPELARLLGEGYENKMIPVDKWAAFAEKGGLKGAVDFLPIKEIAEVLIGLYEARDKSKQDLYEITGIADIIRGNSDPRETAAAQQFKGRFAVLRISQAQRDVQRFARDVMRLLGEIIAENFSLETIQQISGVQLLTEQQKAQMQQQAMMAQQQPQGAPQQSQIPPEAMELLQQPTWEQVHGLLSNQVLRKFRVDIETDSTIATDEDADREARTQFMQAAGAYLGQAVEAGAQSPELIPLLGELLMFGVRSFRSARNLEPAFEDAIRSMEQAAKQPRPDPEAAKAKAEAEAKQAELQMTAQMKQAELQQQAALKREEMQNGVVAEQAKQQAQHQEELARQQIEDQRAQREFERTMELERFKAELNVTVEREKAALDAQTKLQIAEMQAARAAAEPEAA